MRWRENGSSSRLEPGPEKSPSTEMCSAPSVMWRSGFFFAPEPADSSLIAGSYLGSGQAETGGNDGSPDLGTLDAVRMVQSGWRPWAGRPGRGPNKAQGSPRSPPRPRRARRSPQKRRSRPGPPGSIRLPLAFRNPTCYPFRPLLGGAVSPSLHELASPGTPPVPSW